MAKKQPAAASLSVSGLVRRTVYQFYEEDGEVGAEINSEVRLGFRWLTSLYVKHTLRRQGLARQLLQAIIDDFGKEPLYLHVMAFDGQTMSDEQLLFFYGTLGFKQTDTPGILKRPAA